MQKKAKQRSARSQEPGRTNCHGQLRAWLEAQIVDGHLRPGDRIAETDLCKKFNVSRTPVREAFLQLASVGLITFRPRQGAVVAKLSVKELVAMWEVLTGLEGLCAELAARRMTPDLRARLAAVHEASRASLAANDVAGYDEANRRLHAMIYRGTQNDYLAKHVEDIRRRLGVYRRLPFERPGGIERSFQGHDNVVKAILAGDYRAAYSAMREHVSGGLTFLDFIAEITATAETATEENPPSPWTPAPLAAASRKVPLKAASSGESTIDGEHRARRERTAR